MEQIGYSLVSKDGMEIQFWGDTMGRCSEFPTFVRLPNGNDVHAIGTCGPIEQWRLVPRMAQYGAAPNVTFDGSQVIVTRSTPTTMIIAERERRLSAGFLYDFGDARGVHRIGTTPVDMLGWNSVSTLAQAAINLGQPDTPISIVTDSGAVVVTAMEWQRILIAAGAFQQPIWAASFALQSMTTPPMDYANDRHWVSK